MGHGPLNKIIENKIGLSFSGVDFKLKSEMCVLNYLTASVCDDHPLVKKELELFLKNSRHIL